MLTKSQQLMITDGAPAALMLGAEQRAEAWVGIVLKPMLSFADPKIEAQRQMLAEAKRQAAIVRIAKLKANQQRKKLKVDTRGKYWDTRTCKWLQQQEISMAKLLIMPYDAEERLVTRAKTSISDDASPEQILQKMGDAFRRGGERIVKINVTDLTGDVILRTWVVADGPLPEAIPEPVSEEKEMNDMSMTHSETNGGKKPRAKAAKTAKPKKAKAAKPAKERKGTKLDALVEMMKRANGVSSEEASEKLAWKGVSISKWAKRAKVKFTKEKDKNGVLRYYAS